MKLLITAFLLIIVLNVSAQRMDYADSWILNAQYTQVIEWADGELAKQDDSARTVDIIARKAEALVRLGRFSEAESLLASVSIPPSSVRLQATIDMSYGSLFLHAGLYERAGERLQSALDELEASGDSDAFDKSQVLSSLGNLRRATGEHAQAEEYLLRSLALRLTMFGASSEWIAAVYNDLGLVYAHSDPDKALSFYEKALRIYEQQHEHIHPKIAIALTNIGFAYTALELYGDATNNFEEALKIWDTIYKDAHPAKAFLNLSLGEIYRKLKNFDVASSYIGKAIGLYRSCVGNKHPDLAVAYNALGNVKLELGQPEEALTLYQQALISNISSFNDTDSDRMPAMQNYYNGRTLLNTMLYRARALESRYLTKSIRMRDLVAARDALLSCDTLVSQLRQQITNESDKISLGAVAAQVYQSGVRICVAAADVAFNKRSWNHQAFFFAEKGKSAVLLEGIAEVKAKHFARIPEPLLEEERQLRAAITLAMTRLAQKPSPDEEHQLREQVSRSRRQYEQFTERLEADFPQYYNLKYNTAVPAVAELQRHLDEKTAIVSYLTDDDHKGLYIFVISRKEFRIEQRPLPDDLERHITGLRNGLVFNVAGPLRQSAEALSAALLPGLSRGISDLVIIPTGRLGMIPFEVLLSSDKNLGSDTKYWIEKYSIRYEFTAALILQKAIQETAKRAVLLCAPVTFNNNDLDDLPGTEEEVRALDALFSRYDYERTTLTHEQATEESLRKTPLNEYRYLHFATHGIVDEVQPELSHIFLTSGDHHDGMLYSGELYNLELNADLVTLSACQTGLGKLSKGEGVIGLSRALAYAGAKRMVVSFWRVPDASTAALMQTFYEELLNHGGDQPAVSLRRAKMKMLETQRHAAPYYWAAFVMIGF